MNLNVLHHSVSCVLLTLRKGVVIVQLLLVQLYGGVAQVVEQTAHIRWVRGSNPFAAMWVFGRRHLKLLSCGVNITMVFPNAFYFLKVFFFLD